MTDANPFLVFAPPEAALQLPPPCQSLANPAVPEYWHIGEMTTRFGSRSTHSASGEKRSDAGIGRFFGEGR